MGILVSAVLSLHNRSKLFKRALEGYLWQTMPRTDFELIIIDDMSSEDLSKTYEHLKDEINIRHVKIDHTRHFVYKQRNPRGSLKGAFENWYHTPAISINVGCHLARGPVICLCHPEILHAPWNFERAVDRLKREKVYLFGTTYLGDLKHNAWMDQNPWHQKGWNGFLRDVSGGKEIKKFKSNELYWYTSFLPKEAVEKIGGVDFTYLNGAAGEDDDFKERVSLAGWPPVYAPELEGFHQDHFDEKEAHRQRNTKFWDEGLKYNRILFKIRTESSGFPMPANRGFNWTASECIVSEDEFPYNEEKVALKRKSCEVILPPPMPKPKPEPEPEPEAVPDPDPDERVKRVLVAPIMRNEPRIGIVQAFQGIFGLPNVSFHSIIGRFENGLSREEVGEEFYGKVLKMKPDWIWLQVHDNDILDPDVLERIKKALPYCVISHWMGDMRDGVGKNISAISRAAHLTLISSTGQIPLFESAGAQKVRYLQIGLDWQEDVLGLPSWKPTFQVPEVVFCGNHYGKNFPGTKDRAEVVSALQEAGIDVGVVGDGWPKGYPVAGRCATKQQMQVYRLAKVALSVNHFNDVELYYSDRQLVTMASGTPTVAKYIPGLEREFRNGEHCFWYNDLGEAVEIVKRLLSDEELRKKIGRQGRSEVIRSHSWFSRILEILPAIEDMKLDLVEKSQAGVAS